MTHPFPQANCPHDGPARFVCRCGEDAWIAWWGGGTQAGMDRATRKYYTPADGIQPPEPGAVPVKEGGVWVWRLPR